MSADERIEDFLDEAFLRKLEMLKVLARRGVKGPLRGRHPAVRTGASLEFLDYRNYQPGDDLRYVDWNAYGRLDRLFLKLFREEEDLTVHLLLDMSLSMAFGTPRKSTYAKRVAASVGYIALANLDRVGITSFSDSLGDSLSPVRGKHQYLTLLRYLVGVEPSGKTRFNGCCRQYASLCKRPGAAVVITDLLDPEGFMEGLDALRYRKFDISLIQVLDPLERHPSLEGYLRLREVETGEMRRLVVDGALQEHYVRSFEGFLGRIRDYCRHYGIDYHLAETAVAFEDFLMEYVRQGTFFH